MEWSTYSKTFDVIDGYTVTEKVKEGVLKHTAVTISNQEQQSLLSKK